MADPTASPRWGPRAHMDRRRAKEFHRYYDPIRALSSGDPLGLDLHDDAAVAAHKPIVSPDRALTAFCQLAAVKLDVKRAMLFFFDAQHGYVLAEATKSLLFRTGARAEGDDLWLGHTVIPLGYSVCEHTVNLPANAGSNRSLGTASMAHVVNDLAGDVRFCNRPYVTDGPLVRFYAGVPITTPAGINIGALCALDDKPHAGIDDDAIEQLVDLSAAVMSHLEALRAKAEYQRGSVMLTGLNGFLDRVMDTHDDHGRGESPKLPRDHELSLEQSISKSTGKDPEPVPIKTPMASQAPVTNGDESALPLNIQEPIDDEQPEVTARGFVDHSSVDGKSRSTRKRIFALASQMIRESMDVDGVVFYDTSPLYTTSMDGSQGQQQHMAYATSSGTSTASDEALVSLASKRGKPANEGDHGYCPLLASAFSTRGEKNRPPSGIMSRRFLKLLNRRYDSGKVWSLGAGQYQWDDTSASSSSHISESHSSSHAETGKTRRTNRTQEVAFLRRLLPEAQHVLFLPVWDHVSGRWTAGALMYTNLERRSLTTDVELRFMRAFCDVIMAELGRMDAQALVNAKSTFVSSISHELRTPLHGILGTVEYLHDQVGNQANDANSKLISQISICGNAMLDIVNHILDYSHINNIVQDHRTSSHDSGAGDDALVLPARLKLSAQGKPRQQPKIDLDRATEEIVGSAIYSFDFISSQHETDLSKVTTILDVEQGPLIDWTCRMSIGAWKRICINLVTNALKYTTTGYVHTTLSQKRSTESDAQSLAILTVADTGRGMSKEFMEASLFRPFEQEDEMTPGTGLGMSLVAKLVKAMGGDISVRAKQNVGTTVTVTIPLVQTQKAARQEAQTTGFDDTANDSRIESIDFIGPSWEDDSTPEGRGRQKLQASLRDSLRQIIRASSEHASSQTPINFSIVDEEDLEWMLLQKHDVDDGADVFANPLIVVHRTHQSRLRNEALILAVREKLTPQVESIVGPYGSFQIAKALQTLMRASNRTFKLSPTFASPLEVSEAPKRPRLRKRMSSNKSRKSFSTRQSTAQSSPLTPGRPDDSPARGKESTPSVPTFIPPTGEQTTGEADTTTKPATIHSQGLPTPALTPSAEHPIKQTPTEQEIQQQQASQLSILLVDDNDINMRLLIMYAKKMGSAYVTAADGLEAIDAYRKGSEKASDDTTTSRWPQVILMDISMPKCNGFEATRQIRALEAKAPVPRRSYIIAMTGLGSESARQEAMLSGMDLFLTKPVRFKELSRVLEGRPWMR